MDKSKKRKAGKILKWFNAHIDYLVRVAASVGFPATRKQATDRLKRRKYAVGQWHRWYQANKKYQKLTGQSLYRWQVY